MQNNEVLTTTSEHKNTSQSNLIKHLTQDFDL